VRWEKPGNHGSCPCAVLYRFALETTLMLVCQQNQKQAQQLSEVVALHFTAARADLRRFFTVFVRGA
jgi:hypothetical protein